MGAVGAPRAHFLQESQLTSAPQILSLATAAPDHVLDQAVVSQAARAHFGPRYRDFERLFPVFANTGIRERQAVRPMAWYQAAKTWPERTVAYLDAGVELFVRAAEAALAKAGLEASAVDTVVTISSSGIATPSLEARAMARMSFRTDIARVPVFGLGCAGGVSGLSLAARLAKARPGEIVLVVAVELCTLAFRLDELTSANLVATALFGDGAAACILSTAGRGVAAFEDAGEHTWPDSLGIMGWRVDADGLGVIFDRSIPPFILANLRPAVEGIAGRMGLAFADIDRFVCHPGGAKVLEALESVLDLAPGALEEERAVLAEHGNMSAPTVLFVLERVLERRTETGRLMLCALGPGFTASCACLSAP